MACKVTGLLYQEAVEILQELGRLISEATGDEREFCSYRPALINCAAERQYSMHCWDHS